MSIPASSPQSSAAYRGALLALQKQQRARLQLLIQQTEGALAADWTRGPGIVAQYYAPVIDAYAKALNDLRLAEDDPAAKLSMSWLTSQNAQLASIEQSVKASMLNYGQQAARAVEDAQLAALAKGQQDAEALTQEALSPAWEKGVNPAMLWNRPNPDAIAAWAGRAGNGHPLGDLFANFASEATHEARQVLLMGLATGANPKTLVTGLQQAMGISRSRALTISRTELLGSYRTAAHESYRANADVLQGWLWSAGGNNPCAMCAGMDGTLHDLYEELVDHPCGKCAPLPVTKSWDDILGPLGIDTSDMEETSIGAPGNYTSISEKFDSYSPEKQRAIIGTQTGYDAYKRGEVTLKDFIGVRPAQDGWPSQYYQKSLKELQIPTRQASRLVELRPDLMAKYQAGKLRASDLGKFTPYEQLPKWAQQSREAEIVYQILRNGLPYNMTSHEQGLLITNLEQMLKGELPVNVRAAAERQLLALGQSVERQTVGAAAKDVAQAVEQTASREAIQAADVAIKEDLGRAATHIAEEDVARFTANNAPDIPSVGYHYGNPEHLARLGREGIDVARNRVGAFGQGFYMFSQDLSTVDNAAFVADASFRYGTDAVQVAVHIENPYRFTSEEQWRAIFKEYADKYGFENWEKQFTADLLQQGYDGVIVPASTLEDPFMPVTQIVAIKPGSVRVIIPEGSK